MIINYKKGIIWTNSDIVCFELYIRINNFTTYISIPEMDRYNVEDYISLAKSFIDNYIEYNIDTSAGHPTRDDDIVRYSLETRRVQDKELEH